MRRAASGVALVLACAAGCAPALDRVSPQLPEYRVAILVRSVDGRCRTTTIPALAFATSRQTVTWEVISLDRAACKAGDVRLAAKPRGPAPGTTAGAAASTSSTVRYGPGDAFKPAPGERSETWIVRGLRPGRYQYNVSIGAETEDPELEIWR
jgi:hypothetical protein